MMLNLNSLWIESYHLTDNRGLARHCAPREVHDVSADDGRLKHTRIGIVCNKTKTLCSPQNTKVSVCWVLCLTVCDARQVCDDGNEDAETSVDTDEDLVHEALLRFGVIKIQENRSHCCCDQEQSCKRVKSWNKIEFQMHKLYFAQCTQYPPKYQQRLPDGREPFPYLKDE